MADIPIIYSPTMIRPLLEDRKEMTRRLRWKTVARGPHPDGALCYTRWNAVKPGDLLWVWEEWAVDADWNKTKPSELPVGTGPIWLRWYRHQSPNRTWVDRIGGHDLGAGWIKGRRRASFHMPRWASRITLEVTATKFERLQDISERDAIAEGIVQTKTGEHWWDGSDPTSAACSAVGAFYCLWIRLHGPESWKANPEVVALSFKTHHVNVDQMKEAA